MRGHPRRRWSHRAARGSRRCGRRRRLHAAVSCGRGGTGSRDGTARSPSTSASRPPRPASTRGGVAVPGRGVLLGGYRWHGYRTSPERRRLADVAARGPPTARRPAAAARGGRRRPHRRGRQPRPRPRERARRHAHRPGVRRPGRRDRPIGRRRRRAGVRRGRASERSASAACSPSTRGPTIPPRFVELAHEPAGPTPQHAVGRAGRQGDHLRLGRPLDQDRRGHDHHEVRHGRRRGRRRPPSPPVATSASGSGCGAACRSPTT